MAWLYAFQRTTRTNIDGRFTSTRDGAGLWLWSALEFGFASFALPATLAMRVRVKPYIWLPLFSSSLADFWARRWNTPTSSVLRACCYDPALRLLTKRQHGRRVVPDATTDAAADAPSEADQTSAPMLDQLDSIKTMTRASARALLAARSSTQQNNGDSAGAGVKPTAQPAKLAARHREAHADLRRLNAPTSARADAWCRARAMAFSFAVSGLCHSGILAVMRGNELPDMRWCFLFLLQPPLIIGQQWLQRSQLWQRTLGRLAWLDRCAALPARTCLGKVATAHTTAYVWGAHVPVSSQEHRHETGVCFKL